jgi:hypothetical protein
MDGTTNDLQRKDGTQQKGSLTHSLNDRLVLFRINCHPFFSVRKPTAKVRKVNYSSFPRRLTASRRPVGAWRKELAEPQEIIVILAVVPKEKRPLFYRFWVNMRAGSLCLD